MVTFSFSQVWAILVPTLVSITIWMNYKRYRAGWLLGAIVQAVQIVLGFLTQHWALVGCIVPMIIFLIAYFGAVRPPVEKS